MPTFDLHMHSEWSCDGEKTARELLEIAKAAGLSKIAITDHNTTNAVLPAMELAKDYGIELIPAVELDCLFRERVFHVIGYGIDPENPGLKKIDEDIMEQERKAARERTAKFNAAGIRVDEAEALAHAVHGVFVTGELVGEIVLSKDGAEQDELLKPYFPGGSRSDNPYVNFYWDWCGVGKPAYVHIQYIAMEEAIAAIHQAGGIAVLAHPGQNLKGRLEWLDDILALGMDGVECFSTYHSDETNDYFYTKCMEKGLLVTGGSDFHGKTKPAIIMGEFGLDDEEIAEQALNAFTTRLAKAE